METRSFLLLFIIPSEAVEGIQKSNMIELGALTDELRNECMWDANLDIRELVTSN